MTPTPDGKAMATLMRWSYFYHDTEVLEDAMQDNRYCRTLKQAKEEAVGEFPYQVTFVKVIAEIRRKA